MESTAVAAHPLPQAGTGSPRPFPPLTERLLIIGLDGATFDVLTPMMNAGRMPQLQRLIESGVSGILNSTKPPITPAAWTTFMTGKGPGKHGIVDFEKYDPRANELSFNSTFEIREKTIWELLSEKNLRVGSINVPMTYPPRPVNGFMISGFETPGISADFTWPRELKQDILREIPHYNYKTNWRRGAGGGLALLKENLDYISGSFEQGWQLTQFCGDQFGWDVLMIVYKLVDNLQHKAWKYLDPKYNHRYPQEREMTAAVFAALDSALGKLFEYAKRNDATVLIMSDHGHGSLEGKAQPNMLLKKWGYLSLRSPMTQVGQRLGYWAHRLTKGKVTRFEQGSRGIERDLAVDWRRTRACVMHAGIYGFLYVNLQGRGPVGIVAPGEYERLRDELIERFSAETMVTPDGETRPVFSEIHRAEELYGCSREDRPDMPDLLLAPQPGLAVVRKIRGGSPVRWSAESRLEGTHRLEGVFALHGPNVRRGVKVDGNIVDLTPTVLAALGLRVPGDMEGRVISEAFTIKPTIEREPPVRKIMEEHAAVYTDAERRTLEQRLSELGYLE